MMTITAMLGHVLEHPEIDAVEYFAGDQAVTLGFRSLSYTCVAYDIELAAGSTSMDILSSPGLILAIALAMRVRAGGFALLAPVCSAPSDINSSTME
jgi:hypothetical protein